MFADDDVDKSTTDISTGRAAEAVSLPPIHKNMNINYSPISVRPQRNFPRSPNKSNISKYISDTPISKSKTR